MVLHLAARAGSLHRQFELGVDFRILIFILDLITAFLYALVDIRLAAGFRLVAAPTDGEEKHRLGAAVEMLMKPHFRRHKYASRSPVDALFAFPFLPHERVTGAANDQDMNAGAMAMSLLIGADAPQGHMGLDGLVDHAKDGTLGAATAIETAGI